MQRLDRILSEAGVAGRKELREMIRRGIVKVNGEFVTSPEQKFDENTAEISVGNRVISKKRTVLLMLNKPCGYVTSTDEAGERTVMELVPEQYQRQGVKPAGRLDKETEGLLLLTNDGALAHRIISPRTVLWKCYYAEHEGEATSADVEAFAAGIVLRDGERCLPARLEPAGAGKSHIFLREGKYHQVRRMMASRHMTVTYLKRISVGELQLGELSSGECREVLPDEIFDTGQNAKR